MVVKIAYVKDMFDDVLVVDKLRELEERGKISEIDWLNTSGILLTWDLFKSKLCERENEDRKLFYVYKKAINDMKKKIKEEKRVRRILYLLAKRLNKMLNQNDNVLITADRHFVDITLYYVKSDNDVLDELISAMGKRVIKTVKV